MGHDGGSIIMNTRDAKVKIKNVNKVFGKNAKAVTALKDVNLNIYANKFIGNGELITDIPQSSITNLPERLSTIDTNITNIDSSINKLDKLINTNEDTIESLTRNKADLSGSYTFNPYENIMTFSQSLENSVRVGQEFRVDLSGSLSGSVYSGTMQVFASQSVDKPVYITQNEEFVSNTTDNEYIVL